MKRRLIKRQIKYRQKALENLPNTCSMCGLWYPDLEVHHFDLNRKNNALSNLQIVCKKCHREEIHKMNPPKPKIPGKYQLGTPKWKRK